MFLTITIQGQNARTYDTNDWIPITPSAEETKELPAKRATGRVLNLEAPSQQKFFPEDDHLYRKRRPQPQYITAQKNRFNGPKYQNEYEFGIPPSIPQKGIRFLNRLLLELENLSTYFLLFQVLQIPNIFPHRK